MKNLPKTANVCIVMHHHPLKTDTPLIDHYILENSEKFWKCLDHYPAIKNIICGHVHGDYTLRRNKVTVHTAMATCLQWVKGTEKMAIDKSIGCKLYTFHSNLVTTEAIIC